MEIFNRKIILASKSPRRSFLLKEGGFNFEVRTMDIEEDYPEDLEVEEVAPFLARKKALGSKQLLKDEDTILMTADSVVILNNVIYGKPKNYEDAVRILKELSGSKHKVITGVCLCSLSKERIFAGISQVEVHPLIEAEIHYYLEKFKPFDKAGSYGIQDWFGLCRVKKIEGSYSNIMGLPMELVYEELSKF